MNMGTPDRRVRWFLLALACVAWLGCAGLALAAPAGHRLALVLGNGRYQEHPLKNAVNDAGLIAKSLKEVGFDVMLGADLSQRAMYRLIEDFRAKAQGADVALIYYAGHGVQVRGSNYLIPVDLVPRDEFDITGRSVNLDRIIDMFKAERGRVNIIVIDACRDNPFGSARSLGAKGLTEMQSRPGMFIAYSTSPGNTATDSDAPNGKNSIYSYALSNAILGPGLPVEEAFKNVRRDVLRATGGRQTPWEVTSLIVPFTFNPGGKAGRTTDATAAAPPGAGQDKRARGMPDQDDKALFDVPPEEARQQLAGMGIAWTSEAFAASIKEGDVITARLFLQGGKNVFSVVGNEAALGYLACGDGRGAMLRMLHREGIDLNRLYDRRYRIEGVWITEKTHLLHEWLSRCPKNDVAFAGELVDAGVRWPAQSTLKNYHVESWTRGAWSARDAVKVLIRGGALDPAMEHYRLYRETMTSTYTGPKGDAEFVAHIAPQDSATRRGIMQEIERELAAAAQPGGATRAMER